MTSHIRNRAYSFDRPQRAHQSLTPLSNQRYSELLNRAREFFEKTDDTPAVDFVPSAVAIPVQNCPDQSASDVQRFTKEQLKAQQVAKESALAEIRQLMFLYKIRTEMLE